jgi:hypothetical protein
VTQDTYAKPRSGWKALKPTPFGGVQAAEQQQQQQTTYAAVLISKTVLIVQLINLILVKIPVFDPLQHFKIKRQFHLQCNHMLFLATMLSLCVILSNIYEFIIYLIEMASSSSTRSLCLLMITAAKIIQSRIDFL